MFSRLRERLNRLIAEALPARLAYWASKRVLAHAALTRFSGVSTEQIGALEALDHWESSMLPPRVSRGLARLRASHPASPPIWQADGEAIRPRDLAEGELLESVEVDRLEAVRVVSELKAAGKA